MLNTVDLVISISNVNLIILDFYCIFLGLNNLQSINLSFSMVSDNGLRKLAGLTSLKSLNLDARQITDAGISALTSRSSIYYVVDGNFSHMEICTYCILDKIMRFAYLIVLSIWHYIQLVSKFPFILNVKISNFAEFLWAIAYVLNPPANFLIISLESLDQVYNQSGLLRFNQFCAKLSIIVKLWIEKCSFFFKKNLTF